MRHDTPAHLWDAQEAAKKAQAIITGLTRDEYLADWIRQAAAERQLEIIGEALNRIRRSDPRIADQIPEVHAIIATRNIIVHRYDDVDHVRVWVMLNHDVPPLLQALASLLKEAGPPL